MAKNHFLNELHSKAKMVVHPRQAAARITMGYAVVGGLWILFSDRLLPSLTRDPDTMVILSSAKGFLFVLVTAGILFALV